MASPGTHAGWQFQRQKFFHKPKGHTVLLYSESSRGGGETERCFSVDMLFFTHVVYTAVYKCAQFHSHSSLAETRLINLDSRCARSTTIAL